jgi:hypothetical protein
MTASTPVPAMARVRSSATASSQRAGSSVATASSTETGPMATLPRLWTAGPSG